jgi:hypothetical protein
MSDLDLREAERLFQQNPTEENQCRYFLEMIRAGQWIPPTPEVMKHVVWVSSAWHVEPGSMKQCMFLGWPVLWFDAYARPDCYAVINLVTEEIDVVYGGVAEGSKPRSGVGGWGWTKKVLAGNFIP